MTLLFSRNQPKMNVLKRYKKYIIIDQVITIDTNSKIFVETNPNLIKMIIKNHIEKWMSSPLSTFNIPDYWNKSFSITGRIKSLKPKIKEIIMEPITLDKFDKTLNSCNFKSAPGPSKIPYKFWKNAGPQLKKYIIALLN